MTAIETIPISWRSGLEASRFLQEKRPREALVPIERCLRAERSGWAYLLRARAKQALGFDDLAIADVTRAFDADPECGWIFDLPVERLVLPPHAAARVLFEQNRGFRRQRGCYCVRAFVGKLQVMAGRKSEGLSHLDWAVQAYPDRPYLYAWRAEARRRSGDLEGSLGDAERALTLDPRQAVARAARAATWRLLGRLGDALREAASSSALARTYEIGPLEAARACLALGDAPGLLRWLTRAVRRAGRLGWRSLYEGGPPRFVDFERLDRHPRLSERGRARLAAWHGEVLLGTGDAEGAVERLRLSLGADPTFAWGHTWLGEALDLLGDSAGALRSLDRGLALDPRYARAWVARGRLRLRLGQGRPALEDLDRAVLLEPDWALCRFWRSKACASSDAAAALKDAERALRLDPRFAQALMWRGALRRAAGDATGALMDFRRCRELLRGRAA